MGGPGIGIDGRSWKSSVSENLVSTAISSAWIGSTTDKFAIWKMRGIIRSFAGLIWSDQKTKQEMTAMWEDLRCD